MAVIDAAEVERGRTLGKPREKFVSIDEMFSAARKGHRMLMERNVAPCSLIDSFGRQVTYFASP